MTLDEMVLSARVAALECGPKFWLDLAKNKSCDHESCYLCGCDIEYMGGDDSHENWCPTLIARRVLGISLKRPPK